MAMYIVHTSLCVHCSCLQVGNVSDTIRAECVFWNFSLNDDRYVHIIKMIITKLSKASVVFALYHNVRVD